MKYLIWSKFNQKNLLEKCVFLLSFSIFMCLGFNVDAQRKPLDNWDLETLAKGKLQNESYFSFSKQGENTFFKAQPYIRYGLMSNVELQFGWIGTRLETSGFDEADQVARVGMKAYLNDEGKFLPGFSVIGSMNLTTSPSLKPWAPAINVLFRKGIINNFTLTGNYQLTLDEHNGDLGSDYAVNLDVLFTDWLTSYIGVKGVKSFPVPDGPSLNQHYVELGMLFWVADGFRLYPYYDIGLDDESENIFTLGVIYLFH